MAGGAVIVAGFGFRQGATVDSLSDALLHAGRAVDGLATAADKADTAAFRDHAQRMQLPIYAIESDRLIAQKTLTQSAASHATRGTGSVAEAAALAASGPGARLLGPRVVSTDGLATCALAERENE